MHIPIKPERQRRRALRVLLEVEEFHVAQCECPESCKMLRELREEIAWLRHQRHRKRFKCREGCSPTRTHQTCDRFVVRTCYIGKTGRLPFRGSYPEPDREHAAFRKSLNLQRIGAATRRRRTQ